jgi:hypothetical protein
LLLNASNFIGLEAHISLFGDIHSMPYWTHEQEKALVSMVQEGKGIEEICEFFGRSPEAIALKAKRLGIPLGLSKVTTITTTTSLEPVQPAGTLLDFEAAMKLLLGAIKRLREPNLSAGEVKQLRLLISATKAYASLFLGYMNASGEELHIKKAPKPTPQPKKTENIAERVTRLKDLLKEG